jgi:hypothetical protein
MKSWNPKMKRLIRTRKLLNPACRSGVPGRSANKHWSPGFNDRRWASPQECCFPCYEILLKSWIEARAGEIWSSCLPESLWDPRASNLTLQSLVVFTCKLIFSSPLAPARIMFRASSGQAEAISRSQKAKYCWNLKHCCIYFYKGGRRPWVFG